MRLGKSEASWQVRRVLSGDKSYVIRIPKISRAANFGDSYYLMESLIKELNPRVKGTAVIHPRSGC